MVERIPAEKWISERNALALIWGGARKIPDDYARATAPLYELMASGRIVRRGGAPLTSADGEVWRHKSVDEHLEEGNTHIAAIDPHKVTPWTVHMWDTAAQRWVKVTRGSQQEKDERRRIAHDRQAAQRRALGIGDVVVQQSTDSFHVEHAPAS